MWGMTYRRIVFFIGKQIRRATVRDLRDISPSGQAARALTGGFAVWPYHHIDDPVLQHAADCRCRLRRIAIDLFPRER
jgi:hypothetical protein